MPELPEVETVKKDLNEAILGLVISQVKIKLPKIVKTNHAKFTAHLSGNAVVKIERRGKFLILRLKKGKEVLLAHLRMTGQLVFVRGKKVMAGGHGQKSTDIGKLPGKHTHLIFEFENGGKMFFNDQRQFGFFKLVSPKKLEQELKNFGPDALGLELDHFQAGLKKRKAPIKNLLLNQKLVAGLGNIYASEILFESGVDPTRAGGDLKKGEVKKIHAKMQDVLKKAIEARGTTFSDFVDGQGRSGNFSDQLQVFGREGEVCLVCGGKIEKIKQAGRSTFFCARCQK